MFQDLKDSKNDLPEILSVHADPTLFKYIRYMFKISFDLFGFTWVSMISRFQRFIKIPPSCFSDSYFKRSVLKIVLDPPNITIICSGPSISKLWIFKMLRSIKIRCSKYVPIFLILFKVTWYVQIHK